MIFDSMTSFSVIVCLVLCSSLFQLSGAAPARHHHHHDSVNHCPTGCSDNSDCFFGKCFCQPGYTGADCKDLLVPANPWYTEDCPNLTPVPKFKRDDNRMSSGKNCKTHGKGPVCQILCFSHPESGVMQVPFPFWKTSLSAENTLWAKNAGKSDRGPEHTEGFGGYAALKGRDLGRLIEIGAGPWTQTREMMNAMGHNINLTSVAILEPNLLNYIKKPNCAYNTGTSSSSVMTVPVTLYPHGSERLHELHSGERKGFDTLLTMNVVEHVQNGYIHFQNIYNALKPGGLLIFHERYYSTPGFPPTVVLGDNLLHPIRPSKLILDMFLEHFDPIYVNWNGTQGFKSRAVGETGVYLIGTKK